MQDALNAAALRPTCKRHPDRVATSTLYGIAQCLECVREDQAIYHRAFGTGIGPEAHAEAQESGAYQAEYERLAPPKQTWRVKDGK